MSAHFALTDTPNQLQVQLANGILRLALVDRLATKDRLATVDRLAAILWPLGPGDRPEIVVASTMGCKPVAKR